MKGSKKLLILISVLLILIFSSFAYGATIHGTIYDKNANPISGVVVEVNSLPLQRHISQYGGYSFSLENGNYTLKVYYTRDSLTKLIGSEDVVISSGGDYNVDLFASEDLNFTTVDPVQTPKFPVALFSVSMLLIALVVVVLLIIVLAIRRQNKKEKKREKKKNSHDTNNNSTELKYNNVDKESDENVSYEVNYEHVHSEENEPEKHKEVSISLKSSDEVLKEKIIKFISEKEEEITQKEIRKKMSLSEAKVSELISALEKDKKVTKIKHGRVNVIVLVK